MADQLTPRKRKPNSDISFIIESPKPNQFLLSPSMQDGRESLGILSLDFENGSNFDFTSGRESLIANFLKLDKSDAGRESLGILQMDQLNVSFENVTKNLPEILVSPALNNTRIFNTGFLTSPKHPSSENLSFNSISLEMPSKIFILTKSDNSSPSFLNNAQIMSPSLLECRSRCSSQPLNNELNLEKRFFWSTGRPTKSNLFTNNIHCGKLNFDDDKEDLFYDSVFIEGNHLAQKIADGSFINDVPENGFLDCTPQPDWPDFNESEVSNKSPKSNAETIFKSIDKMFPNTEQVDLDLKIKSSRTDSTSSKSRDAKDILNNLSEIFNSSHRSNKQKSKGRMLINNLVELLNNSQIGQDCEDSGHSSNLENESLEKDVMDDNKKIITINDHLDSSEKESPLNSESELKKCLSQSLYQAKRLPKKTDRCNSLTSESSSNGNKDTNNVKSKQNSSLGIKLKSRPVNTRIKNGPLKATVPVEVMKKTSNSPTTQKNTSQSKRTSTPINEPKLKPSATSTPFNGSSKIDNRKSAPSRLNSFNNKNDDTSNSSKKSNLSNSSRLRRPSLQKESSNLPKETSIAKIQMECKRRNSFSEGVVQNKTGLKRTNSVGKETGLMSSLHRVRENLLKSPYYSKKSGILAENNVKEASSDEKKVTFYNMDKSVKLKKQKENVRP